MRCLIVLFSLISVWLPAQPDVFFERADSLVHAGDSRGAIRQLEQVISAFPQRAYDQSVAYFRISGLRLDLADYEGALEANRLSKSIRDEIRSDDTAENYARFGEIYLALGQFERALAYLDRARELPFLFPELFAQVNAFTAEAYLGMNQPTPASSYYDKAINLLQIEFGEDDPALFPYLLGAGKAALAAGRADQATSYLASALPLTEEPGVVYAALGEAELAAGNRVEAREQWLRALRYFEARPDAHQVAVARAQLALARLAEAEKEREERLTHLNAAITTLCPEFLPKSELETPRSRELILDRLLLSEALAMKIGDLTSRGDEAALDAALEAALEGATMLDDHLRYVGKARLRWSAVEVARPFFEAAITAAHRYFENSGDEQYLRRAFELAERGRYWELRLYQMILLHDGPFREQLKRELPTRQWLEEAEAALSRDPGNRLLGIQVKQRESAIDRLIEGYQEEVPELYRLLYEQRFARDRQLRPFLDDETAMLTYYAGPHRTFLFVLSADALDVRRLDLSSDSLARWTTDLLSDLREQDESAFLNRAAHGYDELIAPFQSALKKKKKLVIIPHGPLNFLPFGVLPERTSRGDRIHHRKLHYLGVECAITTAPSATVWHQWQERPEATAPEAFSGFAPQFSTGEKEVPPAWHFAFDPRYQPSRGMRHTSPDGRSIVFREEPGAWEAVLNAVDRRLPAAVTFTGVLASEANFRKRLQEGRYLHLAAPAFVNPYTPGLSGILVHFSTGETALESGTDGWLQTPEFFDLPLAGVRLSLDGFEPEPVSSDQPGSWSALGGVLVQSGAQNVVGSLWKDPVAGAVGWGLYYDHLLSGASAAEALQRTCQTMVKEESTAAPWHWGWMTLIGK